GRERRVLGALVVDDERVLGPPARVRELDDLGSEAVEADAAVPVLAEDERLAVLDVDHAVVAHVALLEGVKGAVVEDVAVLVDLEDRTAAVRGHALERRAEVLRVRVDRARDEARLGREGDGKRLERIVDDAERRRLRALPELARRRVLALRQPVDAVVEEDDLEVDVAPEGVDEVVAADREAVAVARDDK